MPGQHGIGSEQCDGPVGSDEPKMGAAEPAGYAISVSGRGKHATYMVVCAGGRHPLRCGRRQQHARKAVSSSQATGRQAHPVLVAPYRMDIGDTNMIASATIAW